MLYKTKKTTSILCYAVFMKIFWLLQGNTNKEKLTWFSCQIWFQMPNMNRFKCSLHQTNIFFSVSDAMPLVSKVTKNIQKHRRQHFWISDSARKKHLNIIEKLKHFLTLLLWNVLNQVYTTYYSTCYLVVYNSFGWLVKAAAPLLCSESFELIIRPRSFFATKWISLKQLKNHFHTSALEA